MKKKRIHLFLSIIILIFVLSGFYYVNDLNYTKTKQIQRSFVEHPENLPTSETAIATSLGFKNLKADIYWLQAVQYIGGNALAAEYKKYLYVMLDLITDLNPYFEKPYIIGQLLLPSDNDRNEDFTEEEKTLNTKQGELIGLKAIKTFCNPDKLKLIREQSDLGLIWSQDKYKNPCSSSKVPYSLAFVYYFYLKDPTEASFYYKVASANDDSLEGAKIMAAIMQGKGGEREKAYFMFLNIGKIIDESDTECIAIAGQLEQLGAGVFLDKSIKLNKDILDRVSTVRDAILGKFDPDKEDSQLNNTTCGNYINKAGRELNIEYISRANDKYKEKNNGKNAVHAKLLFDEGYIDHLPLDYQQYDTYGIVYIYNEETGVFDYDTGTYDEY